MAKFIEAPDLKDLARQVIFSREEVFHVDVNEVMFLKELEARPKSSARCYSLANHPILLFTTARFCIVFYESNIDYFSKAQRAILMLHELSHIPATGDKLIDHNIKDFYEILKMGVEWSLPGQIVPEIIKPYEEN